VAAEAQAQATIVQLATWRNWFVYHTHDSRHSAAGFPDLVLVRERVAFVELKRDGEKPRAEQRVWLDALAAAGMEVYVWTLADFADIGRILERPWRFVPFGAVDRTLGDTELDGPRLIDDDARLSMRPRSAWIPGVGRRDAA
jgi:hypothetical protein